MADASVYTVTFDTNGLAQGNFTQNIPYGNTAKRPDDPVRTDFAFDGWYTKPDGNGVKWTWTETITGNITLYANWTQNTCTVTFYSGYSGYLDDASILPQHIPYGGTAKRPDDPARTGHTFAGWYTEPDGNGVKWTWTETITGNITLYANWRRNVYTVTFHTGGVFIPSQQVPYEGTAKRPDDPARTGHAFADWFTDPDGNGTEWDFDKDTVTSNLQLYTAWAVNIYTVTFYWNYAGAPEPYLVSTPITHGNPVNRPDNPTRTIDYTFDGWFTEAGAEWIFETAPITGNITLYAKWTQITYTVSFDSGTGGSAVTPQTVAHGGKATRPANPTKAGYTFGNWYTESGGSTLFDFTNTLITGNITLYAKWTQITYTVSFDTGTGGSAVAPQTVAHGGKATRPGTPPTRTGYTFGNWYTESGGSSLFDFTNTLITGDTVIYASWTIIIVTYTVSFDTGTDGSAVAPLTVAHGSAAARPANPTKAGHTFVNWCSDAALAVPYVWTTPVTAAVTLYAKWLTGFGTVTEANTYLGAQTGGTTADSPVSLKVNLNLPDTANGWNALVTALQNTRKYVALDLSDSTVAATREFDAGRAYGKRYIVSIALPNTATSIKTLTHVNWENLKTVSGSSIMTIGDSAFHYVTSLTAVTAAHFPNVTTIGASAFEFCRGLAEVNFPNATAIGESAFGYCRGLVEAHFPNARTIGAWAFLYDTSLTTVTAAHFPNATSIGRAAFNSSGLVEAHFPKALTVGARAFYNCDALTTIGLPKVTSLGDEVFGASKSNVDLTIFLPAAAPTITGNPFSGLELVGLPIKYIYICVPSGYSGYTDAWKGALMGGNNASHIDAVDGSHVYIEQISVKTPWPY
jgi:uncharacterized repeat protein (TIGR02543 family)